VLLNSCCILLKSGKRESISVAKSYFNTFFAYFKAAVWELIFIKCTEVLG